MLPLLLLLLLFVSAFTLFIYVLQLLRINVLYHITVTDTIFSFVSCITFTFTQKVIWAHKNLRKCMVKNKNREKVLSVSYTHLTLPTILRV